MKPADALLGPLPTVETAAPELVTGTDAGTQRIERIGLEIASTGESHYGIKDNDPLTAVAEVRRADTVSRGEWQIRVETQLRVSCSNDAFRLQARLRAWHGDAEVCDRAWDHSIPRDLM